MKGPHAGTGIVVRSSDSTLCGDLSALVMRLISDLTPELEILSIDEIFLSPMASEPGWKRTPASIAAVLRWTGKGLSRHRADRDPCRGAN